FVRGEGGAFQFRRSMPFLGLSLFFAVTGFFVLLMFFSPVKKKGKKGKRGAADSFFPKSWYVEE
ncbi:MAG: hypothetical protein ACYTHN_22630, partial [Planctomycetota bacterium]